jgi:hypothetical protein
VTGATSGKQKIKHPCVAPYRLRRAGLGRGRPALVSRIASGKPGWLTPTGNFNIFNKDIDHLSRSFGSVVDAYGRVVSSSATPSTHLSRGSHYRPAPMPYFMEFSRAVGMHAGYLPGYPASPGCVRMPRDLAALFSSGFKLEPESRSSAARSTWLASEGPCRFCRAFHLCRLSVDWK